MEKVKTVGIWIRVSTEEQAKGESAEHHEKRARFYAESKGWQVKEVYQLEAVSGKSVMNYPETKQMLLNLYLQLKPKRVIGILYTASRDYGHYYIRAMLKPFQYRNFE